MKHNRSTFGLVLLSVATTLLTAFTVVQRSDSKAVREKALKILQAKCNVCHRQENPRMVFTEENMDKRARKVNLQVFVLGRMPKGNDIRLSPEENKSLKNWIKSVREH